MARDNPQLAYEALKRGLEALGSQIVTQPNGIMDSLWPWLEQLVPVGEGIDSTMEVSTMSCSSSTSDLLQILAQWMPQKVIALYDQHVDTWQRHCQQNAVNATTKSSMRSWLLRARRMYQASGQSEQWEKRSEDLRCASIASRPSPTLFMHVFLLLLFG